MQGVSRGLVAALGQEGGVTGVVDLFLASALPPNHLLHALASHPPGRVRALVTEAGEQLVFGLREGGRARGAERVRKGTRWLYEAAWCWLPRWGGVFTRLQNRQMGRCIVLRAVVVAAALARESGAGPPCRKGPQGLRRQNPLGEGDERE
ncbi:hypothetical protein O3P69_002494 [Scylla paramamosain]|uniref:Uncharacterized protein n=1 Tax=Scylla paramamosain TaxID=85552 RepID=A0AAW0ULH2_SCYPA